MNKLTYYAGIGSREISKDIENLLIGHGKFYATLGYVLRSGGAQGSDSAFEKGCDMREGKKEIYLPWPNFNGSDSPLFDISHAAIEIAKEYHPAWNKLTESAKLFHSRNVYQVLGKNLKTPVKFVLCYTKGGKGGGGTGQAIRIAKDYNIPIIDFGLVFD